MLRADYTGDCTVCDGPIRKGDPIMVRKGRWAHPRCANGGDDE